MVQHSIDRESEIGQNPRFADQSSSGNSDRRVNHLRCCAMEKNHLKVRTDRGARHDGGFMAMQSVI
jgi:hypothetical protein